MAVLKSLALDRPFVVPASRQAGLLAGRPRQGTMSRWPGVGSLVADLVEGRQPEPRVGLLSPTSQEVLCAEYLRTPEAGADGLPRVAALLLPVGRTLRDLDAVGLTEDGRRVVVQVTHHHRDAVGDKFDRLEACAADGDEAVLFCRCDEPEQQGGVTVYPLARAFDRFTTTGAGRAWLDAVLLRDS